MMIKSIKSWVFTGTQISNASEATEKEVMAVMECLVESFPTFPVSKSQVGSALRQPWNV